MQAIFSENNESVQSFRALLSEARFSRYLHASNNDAVKAIDLYYWNARLSQSFYITLQMWEIALRNKLNSFLCYRYGTGWPWDTVGLVRQLKSNETRKLVETIDRQRQQRGITRVPTDAIVADLSAGFWVGLLTKGYEVPFVWRKNLTRIFPYVEDMTREEVWPLCDRLLGLRNRVAHHEPIFHLALHQLHEELVWALDAMAPEAYALWFCGLYFSCRMERTPVSRLAFRGCWLIRRPW
jgi:hypothetical protein